MFSSSSSYLNISFIVYSSYLNISLIMYSSSSCLLSLKQNRPTMQSQNCSWGSAEFSYASCILQGKLEAQIKTKLHLKLGALKEEFNPSWEYKPCLRIPVFYSTRCEDWIATEDTCQESFQGSQLPILHIGCSYG